MEDCYKEIDKVVDRILEALDGVRYSVAMKALDKSRIRLDDNAIVHKKEKDIVMVTKTSHTQIVLQIPP